MKFSIAFKYSNVTFKNKETKETITYDTKASEGNSFVFDNVDEDVVIGIVKGIKDKKASAVFSYDNFRTNFINTLARNKCKELYDKLDKNEWKIGDISVSNITIKDVEFTKPTMNAREAITVESRKRISESYWMTDYKWDQPYEVVFTDGSTFTIPGETEDPINFYRHYNNKSYKEIMRKTYGSGLELGKEIDHFNMPNGNALTMDDIQDELDFYYDELKAKHSFNETSRTAVKSSKRKQMLEELIDASKDNDSMWADLIDIYEKYFGEYKIERPFKYGYANESSDGPEPVIFKKDKNTKEVIAFFPETMFDGSVNRGNIMSYAHNGQHGEASIEYFQSCKPCSEEEYADLLTELEEIYTDGLEVVKKANYGRGKNRRQMWPTREY